MEEPERSLLDRIRQGDHDALGEYLQQHRLLLLAFISRNLGMALKSRIESEDILQEVTVDALRRIGEFADSDRDLFGWLCRIAERRVIDAHRRLFGAQKRAAGLEVGLDARGADTRRTPLVNMLVASMTSPSQAFSRDQKELQLREALASLPEESREALRLRYVENYSSKQIAERLGKSDGAVRVLLSRSLGRLQAIFDGG